jgi:hypothetical protein
MLSAVSSYPVRKGTWSAEYVRGRCTAKSQAGPPPRLRRFGATDFACSLLAWNGQPAGLAVQSLNLAPWAQRPSITHISFGKTTDVPGWREPSAEDILRSYEDNLNRKLLTGTMRTGPTIAMVRIPTRFDRCRHWANQPVGSQRRP